MCTVGALALSLSAPAFAQTQAPAAEAANAGALEEVVVTAQKRSENLQTTPVAITAVPGDNLARAGVKDFTNLSKLSPDVQFANVVGSTSVGVRGVRASSNGPTSEYPIAMHLDGIFLSRATGLQGLFFDIQRIEILKGPQGTLYGRNATGGVINIITNKPTQTFGGYAEAEAGNYNLLRAEAALNVPVTDTLAVRGAFRKFTRDGYYANGLDDADQTSGRLSAEWRPTTRLTLFVSGDVQSSDRKGAGTSVIDARNRQQTNAAGPLLPPFTNALTSDAFALNTVLYPAGLGPQREYQKTWGWNAQADYDLDFATLTAQVGRRFVQYLAPAIQFGSPASAALPGVSRTNGHSQTTSGEVRLSSKATTPLQWVVGGFYFTENTVGRMCQFPTFAMTGTCTIDIDSPYQLAHSYAAFGQATWTPAALDSRLHLTGGLRYNYDKKEANSVTRSTFGVNARNGVLLTAAGTGVGGAVVPDLLMKSWDKITGKLGAAYDITGSNMVYASVSTGYQSGGFAYGTAPQYKPERITAYEVGIKNRFFDRRLQVNVDFYRYEYKNQTQNVTVPSPTPPAPPFLDLTVQSIGAVTYQGISLDTAFAATPVDRLEFGLEYEPKANYADYVIPARFAPGPSLDLTGRPIASIPVGTFSGARVNNTPKVTGRASYVHTFKVFGGDLEARGDIQFAGRTLFGLAYAGTIQSYNRPAYASEDVSLRYAPQSDKWNITGYVNNLSDKRIVNSAAYGVATGLIQGTYLAPRTYGVIVRANF